MIDAQQEHFQKTRTASPAVIALARRYRIPAVILGLAAAFFAGSSYTAVALCVLVAGFMVWVGYHVPVEYRRSTEAESDTAQVPPRPYVRTVVACLVCLLFMLPQQGGLMLMSLLPILLLLYVPYGIGVIWGQPARRKRQALKLSFWLITVSAIAGMHVYYYHAAQADADDAVAAVMKYHARVGEYPLTLADAGISSEQELRHKWHLYYTGRGEDPSMTYFSTFMPFCTRSYDFRSGSWEGRCS